MAEHVTRRAVLAALGALGVGGGAAALLRKPAPLETALDRLAELPDSDRMPALFVGHGTPRSAYTPNLWTEEWVRVGKALPRPAAILMISAHWITEGGSLVTAS